MPYGTKDMATPTMRRLFKGSVALAVIIVVAMALPNLLSGRDVFQGSGNDDIMRLMSVRDWLAGQGWFDMSQHRLIPGEGVSLHWSRYVDAGIGAIVAAFSMVLPMATAEGVAAVLWPMILAVGLIGVVATSSRRLFSPAAGGIAALMVVCYPPLVMEYFDAGRLDHHNLQIMLMTIAVLMLVRDDNPRRLGAVSGCAVALSLATGLETLFMVVTLSLMHVVDAALGRTGGRTRLVGYCAALFLGAVVFFLGQTPAAQWTQPYCDELGMPLITLAGIGCASALAGLIVPGSKGRPALFLLGVAAAAGVGLAVGWPILSPCLQAPYANLPHETREMISTSIIEALPLFTFASQSPTVAYSYFGPALAVLCLATIRYSRNRRDAGAGAVVHLLVIGWIGLLASTWQMRQVVILATVVPVLTGYLVAPVLHRRLTAPSGRTQMALYGVAAVTLFQPALLIGAEVTLATSQAAAGGDVAAIGAGFAGEDEACNDLTQLAALNAIPPSVILTGTNLGPRLIMATHHSGLAAPYHRSNAALTNGFILRLDDPDAALSRMSDIGADVIVVCKNSHYGVNAIGTRLAVGEAVPGFDPIALTGTDVMAFRPAAGQ